MRILRCAGRFWTGVLAVIVALAALLIGARLLLPIFSAPPALRAATPLDSAGVVAIRARMTLRFDRAMNPRSVEQAIQISPPVGWTPSWNADRTTLTISPTEPLQPDTDYRLWLSEQAQSQRFRALEQPVELRFHTAPAPEVIAVLPADQTSDVARDSPISITFSRTIVPTSTVMLASQLPALQFDPPLAGRTIWLDQATVLFRPDTLLQAGTRYRATLAATLADLNGGQLSKAFEWSFSTAAPQVLAVAPSNGARMVAPRATLALTVSQPLAIDSLRATLAFSPTITGQLSTSNLDDGRQLITYQPDSDLQPDTTYVVTLPPDVAPANGNLPLSAPLRWSFTTAPRPALIGRFPGEGQTLPSGQEIRLVFNTPIDSKTFSETFQLAPPAPLLRVTSNDSEIRIGASLRAATVYTITLPAALADRNGIPLGQEYRIRFLTAPAGPTLELPEVGGHVAQITPGSDARLLVRRTNISALNIDIYQLDESAIVRTLGFTENDWPAFQPERYRQTLLRSWRLPFADQLNTPAQARISLAATPAAPLPAGAYYLRLRTLEGPRADLLLLVARTRLALQNSGSGALIWATDVISGTPAGGLPVALYQAGALVRQGVTGPDGLLRFAGLSGSSASAIAIAGGPLFGGASSASAATNRQPTDQRAIFVTADRTAYHAGEVVQVAGFVHPTHTPTGTLALPPNTALALHIRQTTSGNRIYQRSLDLAASGVFSATAPLATDTPAGEYTLTATSGGVVRQASFTVQPAAQPPLHIAVGTPAPLVAGEVAPLAISVSTAAGFPAAGATISWTLDAERMPFPAADGTLFGDDEQAAAPIAQRAGAGSANADGRLQLIIAGLVGSDVPLRYRLTARATEPGGATSAGAGTFIVAPARRSAGVRLPSRIFTAGATSSIEVLALDPLGQPAPRTDIRVEVYRREWLPAAAEQRDVAAQAELKPRDRLLFTRGAVTGADGRISVPLRLATGGAYRLRVSAADPSSPPAYSAVTIWATAANFSDWGALPGGPLLIADRPAYRRGETATLLVTSPFGQANALITRGDLDGEVRVLRAGSTFTLTIQASAPPELPVSVLLAARAPSAGAVVGDMPALPAARTVLPIIDDRQPLKLAITSDQTRYRPGATATLTITTSTADGMGVPANLILGVSAAAFAPASQIAPAIDAAQLAGAPSEARPALQSDATAYWNPALQTGANGVISVTVRLPQTPVELRAQAWAASAGGVGQAQSTLVVTQPLNLRLVAPPGFRAGDQVELAALVENASPSARDITVILTSTGIQTQPGIAQSQRVRVAAGATARVAWPVRVLDAAVVHIQVSARAAEAEPQNVELEQAILPAARDLAPHNGGIALLREYLDPISGQTIARTQLRAGQLVRVRLTIVSLAAQRNLAIEEPLPAGALLVASAPGSFDQIVRADGQITLQRTLANPGITDYDYFLRVVASGSFSVPATTARAAGRATGVGDMLRIEVLGR